MARKLKIAVAMSGGVDSSAVAALLVQHGHRVIGLTMQIWQESQTDSRHAGCCSLGAVEDARRVAHTLGIPYYVLNFRDSFRESVIQRFIEEYTHGRTPNPCIACNRYVKFDLLLDKARELGCDSLATGHYARVRRQPSGRFALMRALCKEKDQSYALYAASQEQLARLRFPLGTVRDKTATRALARSAGLAVADKQESQDICFVSEAGGYREFLRARVPQAFRDGPILDREGNRIGTHDGLAQYTVGQRKGIGIATGGKPLFVLALDPASNALVVGDKRDTFSHEVTVEDVVWGAIEGIAEPLRVSAKIRYNMAAREAVLLPPEESGRLTARFVEPVSAVTPGQAAVFYRGETVVAGGTIAPRETQ
ncbi:MAG: tRNA 2-thiouridine(34) synthase MnmA [Fimbriimonadia bacterium]|jgi:tRNA-specific 2-thiouridylase